MDEAAASISAPLPQNPKVNLLNGPVRTFTETMATSCSHIE